MSPSTVGELSSPFSTGRDHSSAPSAPRSANTSPPYPLPVAYSTPSTAVNDDDGYCGSDSAHTVLPVAASKAATDSQPSPPAILASAANTFPFA